MSASNAAQEEEKRKKDARADELQQAVGLFGTVEDKTHTCVKAGIVEQRTAQLWDLAESSPTHTFIGITLTDIGVLFARPCVFVIENKHDHSLRLVNYTDSHVIQDESDYQKLYGCDYVRVGVQEVDFEKCFERGVSAADQAKYKRLKDSADDAITTQAKIEFMVKVLDNYPNAKGAVFSGLAHKSFFDSHLSPVYGTNQLPPREEPDGGPDRGSDVGYKRYAIGWGIKGNKGNEGESLRLFSGNSGFNLVAEYTTEETRDRILAPLYAMHTLNCLRIGLDQRLDYFAEDRSFAQQLASGEAAGQQENRGVLTRDAAVLQLKSDAIFKSNDDRKSIAEIRRHVLEMPYDPEDEKALKELANIISARIMPINDTIFKFEQALIASEARVKDAEEKYAIEVDSRERAQERLEACSFKLQECLGRVSIPQEKIDDILLRLRANKDDLAEEEILNELDEYLTAEPGEGSKAGSGEESDGGSGEESKAGSGEKLGEESDGDLELMFAKEEAVSSLKRTLERLVWQEREIDRYLDKGQKFHGPFDQAKHDLVEVLNKLEQAKLEREQALKDLRPLKAKAAKLEEELRNMRATAIKAAIKIKWNSKKLVKEAAAEEEKFVTRVTNQLRESTVLINIIGSLVNEYSLTPDNAVKKKCIQQLYFYVVQLSQQAQQKSDMLMLEISIYAMMLVVDLTNDPAIKQRGVTLLIQDALALRNCLVSAEIDSAQKYEILITVINALVSAGDFAVQAGDRNHCAAMLVDCVRDLFAQKLTFAAGNVVEEIKILDIVVEKLEDAIAFSEAPELRDKCVKQLEVCLSHCQSLPNALRDLQPPVILEAESDKLLQAIIARVQAQIKSPCVVAGQGNIKAVAQEAKAVTIACEGVAARTGKVTMGEIFLIRHRASQQAAARAAAPSNNLPSPDFNPSPGV